VLPSERVVPPASFEPRAQQLPNEGAESTIAGSAGQTELGTWGRNAPMRLYLVNPSNPLVSIVKVKESRWNRYRVWKPLSLMVLAGLTPPEWEVSILDENLGVPDYRSMPRPDLVGITAFTSQANRAYEVGSQFRRMGVPVVMGGIHATMCLEEAAGRVDSVVTGEAEGVWQQVLDDARRGCLRDRYDGGLAAMDQVRARLSSQLRLLQCDGLQRPALPATADRRRRAGTPIGSREARSACG
jgi:hypothetical protein